MGVPSGHVDTRHIGVDDKCARVEDALAGDQIGSGAIDLDLTIAEQLGCKYVRQIQSGGFQ